MKIFFNLKSILISNIKFIIILILFVINFYSLYKIQEITRWEIDYSQNFEEISAKLEKISNSLEESIIDDKINMNSCDIEYKLKDIENDMYYINSNLKEIKDDIKEVNREIFIQQLN